MPPGVTTLQHRKNLLLFLLLLVAIFYQSLLFAFSRLLVQSTRLVVPRGSARLDHPVEASLADRTGILSLNKEKDTLIHSERQAWQKRWLQAEVDFSFLTFDRQIGQISLLFDFPFGI